MSYLSRLPKVFAIDQHARWLPYPLLGLWQGLLLAASNVETSLMAHDEGWYATLALGLVRSQDWLSPTWWGQLVYDKTSGVHWLIATAYQLFGVSETTARLPSGIACLASTFLLYAIGSTLLHRRAALLGALCLSTIVIWTQYGQMATQDMPLVALELTVIWALLQAEQQPRRRLWWGTLAGLGFGLGFLIKGFMVALPTVALLPYLVLNHRRHRHLFNPGLYLGFVLGLGLVAYWFLHLWQAHGSEPFNQLFGILVLAASEDYHGVGPWYYLWNIPANVLPWTPLVLLGLFYLIKSPPNHRALLTLGYPAGLLLLLQLFSTKTIYYPLQIYPFLGLYSGYALHRILHTWQSTNRRPAIATALSGFYGLIALVALVLSLGLLTGTWSKLGLFDAALQQELSVYSIPALVLSGLWLVYAISGLGKGRSQPHVWLSSLLIGPWLAIGLAGTSGLIGNYSSDIKDFCRQPAIAPVLAQHSVNVVLGDPVSRPDHQVWILTSFCSSQWGKRFLTLEDLGAGQYAWVAPDLVADLTAAPAATYQQLGTTRGWALVQKLPSTVDLE
ncbi:ArnT family glycosyltransferase [Phormidium tenue]|uniref:Glycosyltransferase RgtA/B/C/D-like domain-containing protein n=1 Tax=Phormidium tenue NIES-30 TaxID=549789 RepID=A0A1U7J4I8_9CYAN|nr:glycosyltransferase family 39 protein [Phormidium tenue]MBD2232906.1 glycosyltransferase family 39 protein [Phormidium tenue FACHB-1052]OKH47415.1 hypothetical protein NIES30_13145 [Phormidium tenue NIES-30]